MISAPMICLTLKIDYTSLMVGRKTHTQTKKWQKFIDTIVTEYSYYAWSPHSGIAVILFSITLLRGCQYNWFRYKWCKILIIILWVSKLFTWIHIRVFVKQYVNVPQGIYLFYSNMIEESDVLFYKKSKNIWNIFLKKKKHFLDGLIWTGTVFFVLEGFSENGLACDKCKQMSALGQSSEKLFRFLNIKLFCRILRTV